MKNLQKILGYKFKNVALLEQALVHSSHSSDVLQNYERLEFLGDRVLNMTVAYMLYGIFPNEPEGSLSQRHVALVCKETVALVARHLSMDKYIKAASDDLKTNESVLCDVCEAVIGAIFIDAGCGAAMEFVQAKWDDLIDKNLEPPKDNKTKLQELLHIKGLGVPAYYDVAKEGSEHQPVFHIMVKLENGDFTVGQGHSKKMAEFEAAGKMIKRIEK